LLIADLPFMSYATLELAILNATRLMQAGAQVVKLEGGEPMLEIIRTLASHGVPVCAHLGLLPQSVNKLGGYRYQGKADDEAQRLLQEAKAIEAAGADMVVLECVPAALASDITKALTIPTIGIGAGAATDGQVLVCYDMLGISAGHRPSFSQNFLTGQSEGIAGAITAYVRAVKNGAFPDSAHTLA
jgi:3-methyl-2-oxobutanoate hydroxymethyltransferase